MAYSEALAERVRNILSRKAGLSERKMFGGLAFMLHGNMCCGIVEDRLMLRLGNERAAEALDEPDTSPMDFTGRPMKSMLYVEPPGIADEPELEAWVARAVDFVSTLPPK